MKKVLFGLAVLLYFAFPALAQVNNGNVPYVFYPNTVISSSEVNANFARIFADALNRTAGTMTGTLTVHDILPEADDTYDLGTVTAVGGVNLRFRNLYITGTIAASGSTFTDPVEVEDTSGNAQLFLKYDTNNWLKIKVDSTGSATYDADGTSEDHTFSDPVILSSTLNVTGDTTVSGQIFGKLGSVGSPSFAFTGDEDTGMYSAGTGATDYRFAWAVDGVWFAGFHYDAAESPIFDMIPGNFGTGSYGGAGIYVGNNTEGNGAAGHVGWYLKDGSIRSAWVDVTGLLRIHTTFPRENGTVSDTAGTVVGDQTSELSAKTDIVLLTDTRSSLDKVLRTPVFAFRYKDHRYNNEQFTGVITDYSPEFAKDNGKSLNEINAIGLLVQSIQAQQTEIEALKARIAALEAR